MVHLVQKELKRRSAYTLEYLKLSKGLRILRVLFTTKLYNKWQYEFTSRFPDPHLSIILENYTMTRTTVLSQYNGIHRLLLRSAHCFRALISSRIVQLKQNPPAHSESALSVLSISVIVKGTTYH